MDSRPVILYADSPIWERLASIVHIMREFHQVQKLGLSRDIIEELIDELDFEDGTPEIFRMEILGVELVGIAETEIFEQVHVVTSTSLTIPVAFPLDLEEEARVH